MRLSTNSIVGNVVHRDTTLKDDGVGSHGSCQIQILFSIPTYCARKRPVASFGFPLNSWEVCLGLRWTMAEGVNRVTI